ncbi:hypothetical protein [Actinopolymorpha pittospori]
MQDSTKIALAVVGAYALGRRKKAKMALLLGSVLVGKRLDMRALGKEVMGRLSESPEVGRIVGDVRGDLLSTGRAAAMSALSRPLEGLADRLEERTAGLTGAPSKRRPEEEEEEEEAPRRRRASGRDEGDGSERRRSHNAEPPRQRDQEKESRTPPRTGRRGGSRE